MGRLLILIVILVVSILFSLAKTIFNVATKLPQGKDPEISFKRDAQSVMKGAAKGKQWLGDAWDEAQEQAKKDSDRANS
ncbi:MAG: hypothetical protein O3A95_11080 [Planctomycetota bacterium]|nr:hypothetical protein [Planctomycetota bacterium]